METETSTSEEHDKSTSNDSNGLGTIEQKYVYIIHLNTHCEFYSIEFLY